MWQCKKCREQVEDNFAVCWNCGTAPDGTEDPNFRPADDFAPDDPAEIEATRAEWQADGSEPVQTEPVVEAEVAAPCPLCGSTAERGCVYGSDKGWWLRWHAGPPSFWSNLATGIGGGEPIGGSGFGTGPYVAGVRCHRCRRIVLEY